MVKKRYGHEIGKEYVETLAAYLERIETLPAQRGKINVTAIAEASGVPRQSLYKNEECRALIDNAVATKGLTGIEEREARQGDTDKARLERRVMSLEQSNASLVAENHELRRQLKRLKHVEEMMVHGKRVMP